MKNDVPPRSRSTEVPPTSEIDRICLDCGYDLRAQVEPRCAECGRIFDPADRSTFLAKSHRAFLARWAIKSTRTARQLNRFRWFSIAAMLWGASYLPGGLFVLLVGTALAGAAFPLAAIGNSLRDAILAGYRVHRPSHPKPSILPWIVLIVMLPAVYFGIPGRIMIRLHAPLLTRYADRIYAKEPFIGQKHQHPRMIGLLLVTYVYLSPAGVSVDAGPGFTTHYSSWGGNGQHESWDFESAAFDWNPSSCAARAFYRF